MPGSSNLTHLRRQQAGILVGLALVFLSGCIEPSESDAPSQSQDPFRGVYKEWLDYRHRTVIVQSVEVGFEGHTLVANVTLENLGRGTPGEDTPAELLWVRLAWLDFEDGSGHGDLSAYADVLQIWVGDVESYATHSTNRFVIPENRRLDNAAALNSPLPPGEATSFQVVRELPAEAFGYHVWSLKVDDYFTGCVAPGVEEFYTDFGYDPYDPASGRICYHLYDHCGFSHLYQGIYAEDVRRGHLECIPRPVEAKYYGNPDDRGIP